jgi:hypothetical protein
VPRAYLTISVLLIPWIVYLALTLPTRVTAGHYRLAWVGFDCLLGVAFARTGFLAMRHREQTEVAAVVTATLLIVDAWFDIVTSATDAQLTQAVLLAVFGELPAALLSVYVVRQINREIITRLGSPFLDDEVGGTCGPSQHDHTDGSGAAGLANS